MKRTRTVEIPLRIFSEGDVEYVRCVPAYDLGGFALERKPAGLPCSWGLVEYEVTWSQPLSSYLAKYTCARCGTEVYEEGEFVGVVPDQPQYVKPWPPPEEPS